MSRRFSAKERAERVDPKYIHRRGGAARWLFAVSLLAAAGATAWGVSAILQHRGQVFNPGHLAPVHAMWENNCALCHDGDGHGGFRKGVSDNACLQCHNAPMHHPGQLMREDAPANPLALAVRSTSRSADCVVCHVEHRGHDALLASDDATCTRCHQDLNATQHVAGSGPWMSVTRFDADGHHPRFGRRLLKPGASMPNPPSAFDPSALVDPTPLYFNHSQPDHRSAGLDPVHPSADNCAHCHVPAGNGYMRPVSYMTDCESCHKLKMGEVLDKEGKRVAEVDVPHLAMGMIWSDLADPEAFLKQWATQAPKGVREQIDDSWAAGQASALRSDAVGWFMGLEESDGKIAGSPAKATLIALRASLMQKYRTGSANAAKRHVREDAAKDLRVLAAFVCGKCHQIAPRPGDGTFITLPTGIGTTPRRWFKESKFDHTAHQYVACAQCHSRAKQSQSTADILSPNLTWSLPGGQTASCADCHHAPDARGPGTSANCVACHTFHDKSLGTAPAVEHSLEELIAAQSPVPGSMRQTSARAPPATAPSATAP